MEDYIIQLRDYLPIEYSEVENEEYIQYVTNAYLKNVEAQAYQFAFIAFHLLYMSFVYKTIWLLKKEKYGSTEHYISQVAKDIPPIAPSPFDFSIIEEGASFRILRALRFHPNEIETLASQVKNRNHCSHASGKIHYAKDDIEDFICKELRNSDKILQKTRGLLEDLFRSFITDNWNPDTREFISAKDSAEFFIRQNLFSVKELELLASVSMPELHEISNSRQGIYSKTLYLVFLHVYQTFIGNEENLLLKNLHLLMHEFDKQPEVSLELLINDELSEVLRDFSEKDKDTFAQIVHRHLPNFLPPSS